MKTYKETAKKIAEISAKIWSLGKDCEKFDFSKEMQATAEILKSMSFQLDAIEDILTGE